MNYIKVVPYEVQVNKVTGARCSVLSIPGGKRSDWEVVVDGYTWINTKTGKRGLGGHPAAKTIEEAELVASEANRALFAKN